MEPLSVDDERTAAWQLGRSPRGPLHVECRCRHGCPQVIRVHPILDGSPFPTLFWLTCPFLVKAIDRLEADGWVKRLEDLLGKDSSLARAVEQAHRSYIAERLGLLSAEERASLEARGMLTTLLERGIGGTADLRRVKCLHLHTAHALARTNPIGARVLDLLSDRACVNVETVCSARMERSRPANDRRSS
jgi:hypothetical protein